MLGVLDPHHLHGSAGLGLGPVVAQSVVLHTLVLHVVDQHQHHHGSGHLQTDLRLLLSLRLKTLHLLLLHHLPGRAVAGRAFPLLELKSIAKFLTLMFTSVQLSSTSYILIT